MMGRPKLARKTLQARVNAETPKKLKALALELGYQYGADGNTGKFLDAIAQIPVEELEQLLKKKNVSHRKITPKFRANH